MKLYFQIADKATPSRLSVELDLFGVVGWAGRDAAATEHHT
jgi:hypothetical protein